MNDILRRRRALMSGVESLDPNTIYGRQLTWAQGNLSTSDGMTVTESDRHIYTEYIPVDDGTALTYTGKRISPDNAAYFSYCCCYDASYNFLGLSSPQMLVPTSQDTTMFPIVASGAAYIRFTFGVLSGYTITPANGSDFTAIKSTPDTVHKMYSLVNRVVSAGASPAGTTINFLAANFSGTILFDFDLNAIISSGYGSAPYYVYNYNGNLSGTKYNGLRVAPSSANGGIAFYWMGSGGGFTGNAQYVGKMRVAVTHSANSGTAILYFKTGENEIRTVTKTGTFVAASSNLQWGGNANSNQSLPNGTINKAEVYRGVLSTADLNAFFA